MNYSKIIFVLLVSIATLGCTASKTQEQKKVAKQNERNAEKGLFTEDQAEFLVMAADTRLMGKKIGMLAQERGSSQAVKNYGAMLEKDQSEMIAEIEKVAARNNIILLDQLTKERQKAFDDLSALKESKAIDEKLVRMTSNGHARDLKEFKKASISKNPEIAAFATKYTPVVAKHLKTVKGLLKNYK